MLLIMFEIFLATTKKKRMKKAADHVNEILIAVGSNFFKIHWCLKTLDVIQYELSKKN